MNAILHLSDWNFEDKYYEAPTKLIKELRNRVKRDGMPTAWDWWTSQVDYGQPGESDRPIKTGKVDMTLEEFFLDYTDPIESVKEWEF